MRGAKPNEGVGYVPEKKDQKLGNSKEDRMLRGRLAKEAKERGKWKKAESESEDEVGRSALGKRKRPRRERGEVTGGAETEMKIDGNTDAETEIKDDADIGAVNGTNDDAQVDVVDEIKIDVVVQEEGAKKKRKRKNRIKPKKKAAAGGGED